RMLRDARFAPSRCARGRWPPCAEPRAQSAERARAPASVGRPARGQQGGGMKKVLRIVGVVVGVLVLAFAALVSHFAIIGGDSVREQASRIQQLRELDAERVPSGDTHEFDELPYDELQVVATHNSYNLA